MLAGIPANPQKCSVLRKDRTPLKPLPTGIPLNSAEFQRRTLQILTDMLNIGLAKIFLGSAGYDFERIIR